MSFSHSGARALLPLALVLATPALAQDRDHNARTGWAWWFGVDQAFITNHVASGYRIVDVQVTQAAPLRVNMATVRNTGSHQKKSWWYFDKEVAEVAQLAGQHSARPTTYSSYTVNNRLKYFVVLEDNTGPTQKAWNYAVSSRIPDLVAAQQRFQMRPYLLNSTVVGGNRVYSVVFVRDPGVNWGWLFGASRSSIPSSTRAGSRIVDIERYGDNRYNFISKSKSASECEHDAFFLPDAGSIAEVRNRFTRGSGRIYELSTYRDTQGRTRYTALMVDHGAVKQSFGDTTQCVGSMGNRLLHTVDGVPRPGNALTWKLSGAQMRTPAWLVVGNDNMSWTNLSLPNDLSRTGVPGQPTGCFAEVNHVVVSIPILTTSGQASFPPPGSPPVRVPNSASIIGKRVLSQCWAINQVNQSLRWMATSNGVAVKIQTACANGPSANETKRFGFQIPRIPVINSPAMQVAGVLNLAKQTRCCAANCTSSARACVWSGTGTLSANVVPYRFPLATAATDLIKKVVCDKIDAVTLGTVTCTPTLEMTVRNLALRGSLTANRDGCTGRSGYSGSGSLNFAANVSGGLAIVIDPPIIPKIKFSLNASGSTSPTGSYSITNGLMKIKVAIPSIRLTAGFTIPVLDIPVSINVTIPTPFLQVETPGVAIPAVLPPVTCN